MKSNIWHVSGDLKLIALDVRGTDLFIKCLLEVFDETDKVGICNRGVCTVSGNIGGHVCLTHVLCVLSVLSTVLNNKFNIFFV